MFGVGNLNKINSLSAAVNKVKELLNKILTENGNGLTTEAGVFIVLEE